MEALNKNILLVRPIAPSHDRYALRFGGRNNGLID